MVFSMEVEGPTIKTVIKNGSYTQQHTKKKKAKCEKTSSVCVYVFVCTSLSWRFLSKPSSASSLFFFFFSFSGCTVMGAVSRRLSFNPPNLPSPSLSLSLTPLKLAYCARVEWSGRGERERGRRSVFSLSTPRRCGDTIPVIP